MGGWVALFIPLPIPGAPVISHAYFPILPQGGSAVHPGIICTEKHNSGVVAPVHKSKSDFSLPSPSRKKIIVLKCDDVLFGSISLVISPSTGGLREKKKMPRRLPKAASECGNPRCYRGNAWAMRPLAVCLSNTGVQHTQRLRMTYLLLLSQRCFDCVQLLQYQVQLPLTALLQRPSLRFFFLLAPWLVAIRKSLCHSEYYRQNAGSAENAQWYTHLCDSNLRRV